MVTVEGFALMMTSVLFGARSAVSHSKRPDEVEKLEPAINPCPSMNSISLVIESWTTRPIGGGEGGHRSGVSTTESAVERYCMKIDFHVDLERSVVSQLLQCSKVFILRSSPPVYRAKKSTQYSLHGYVVEGYRGDPELTSNLAVGGLIFCRYAVISCNNTTSLLFKSPRLTSLLTSSTAVK